MTTTLKKENKLTIFDRCDQCPSQAFVSVSGVTGELMFCGHHYNKIVKNVEAYEKLKSFAYEVNDETNRLQEYESARVSEG